MIRETADAVIAGRARHSRHHRQSRFHPSRGAGASAPRDPLDPDRRLRLAVGLGVAARPGARDAAPMSITCWPCCRSSRRPIAALRGPPCSYVGHPLTEQIGAAPARTPTSRSGATSAPPVLLVLPGSRRSEIRHHMAVFGETLGRLQRRGRARSSWCCRPCRICRRR